LAVVDMPTHQDQYDDAMYDFSMGDFDACIAKLAAILAEDPAHFDAQLSLGMAYCRKGDFARAIEEGHKAEKLRPTEQLAHTNLSLFYMRAGNKQTAEHHGLQARISSWRGNLAAPGAQPVNPDDAELKMAQPPPPPPVQIPDQPWKKKQP
jgi:tetratricopeptide (TPR) repeat protein